jgi:hypothetical protein
VLLDKRPGRAASGASSADDRRELMVLLRQPSQRSKGRGAPPIDPSTVSSTGAAAEFSPVGTGDTSPPYGHRWG